MACRHIKWIITASAILVSCMGGRVLAKEQPPRSKLEIVRPAEEATLEGKVEVRVKVVPAVEGRVPTFLFAGLGGPPWTELQRVEQSLEWAGQLDSTMVPNGSGRLIVVAWVPQERRTTATRPVNVKNPLQCYFADLHSHTSYSDGTFFPSDAHAYARNVAGLDVFSLTDHLESVDEAEWADIREQAWKANEDGAFVVIPGLEWSKKQGHMNIFDPQTRQWPEETAAFYQAAADAGVVLKFNHPGDGTTVFDGLAYSETGDKAVQLMEVRRDTEEQAYLRALKLGWHLAPDGSDDTHSPNWGNSGRWTGILLPGLSKRNVWWALKNRHCYSTLDRNCRLHFTVNGAVMGDVVGEPVKNVEVEVAADDPDRNDEISRIELFEDGVVVQTDEPNARRRRWETSCSPQPGPHYYFVKLTQADGNPIWSAPVWVSVVAE